MSFSLSQQPAPSLSLAIGLAGVVLGASAIIHGCIFGGYIAWDSLAIGLITGGSLALFIGFGGFYFLYRAVQMQSDEDSRKVEKLINA